MEDDEMMQLTKALSANVPLSKREDDFRSIFSVCSKGSNVSRSSAAAHENARLQKVLSQKKVEQLKRAKAIFLEFYLKSRMPGIALQDMARCGQDVEINTGRC